ncbi:MAG: aminotransferase class I/II-fold pyridoxal phosphate-dependent enzyme [Chloroflexi bacterium AL-W]|nr:aminotransferase class I/II-fold pyridoxal phosphate-dependent enzyme [Chloroflexi bacterium AL-N1]NOK66147.1 aminotransferase class I/II-fold pyridoxal phosphate-dependent enzyme [Chloroflexi bacterium AL-N10]NOK73028.1 aminotransferase class I/II-fold pyridoxal phosphate-dependent enzyme [Chloroflexi bacterium AL-N5]NOK79925.1 aminotransferase class I/II-fold pyridoxal phosphate-dependent enzyme [Chloroflexi bacterium AL-W]NOK88219.1 aminotransferase class I/II-fold pyridoxal phosphate-dep
MTHERIAKRVDRVPPSGIRRFFDIAATMPEVISLGIGEPDFVTPALFRDAAVRSIQDGHTAYTSNSGLFELREAIAAHLQRLYAVSYDPETEILVTVGVSEALQLAMLATINDDDEVIVPEPCFVAYAATVAFADGIPQHVATSVKDYFQVTGQALEAAITPRTRAILIGYPNNPTGAVMPRERLLEIAKIAEDHDLLVFSDEIYDRLVYGVNHTCFATLPNMRERTVLLGGFSKAYAMTGWRLGWMAAPADVTAAVRKIHQYAIMSAPTMSQYAGLEAILNGEPAVHEMVTEYDRRRQTIVTGLNQIGLPTFEPKGAFYTFPQVSHLGITCEEFAERLLLEQQVAVVPGNAFGPSGEGFVRACYATTYEKIEMALERIDAFVKTLR